MMYMKMKKMLAVGLTCSLAAMLAAGCSDSGKTSGKSSEIGSRTPGVFLFKDGKCIHHAKARG